MIEVDTIAADSSFCNEENEHVCEQLQPFRKKESFAAKTMYPFQQQLDHYFGSCNSARPVPITYTPEDIQSCVRALSLDKGVK
jgi:hypothetical protein